MAYVADDLLRGGSAARPAKWFPFSAHAPLKRSLLVQTYVVFNSDTSGLPLKNQRLETKILGLAVILSHVDDF